MEQPNAQKQVITTYEPDNSLRKGYLHVFREIYRDLKENRYLTYQLFKRDILGAYKQSLMGIFWAFLIPIIVVGSFAILNFASVLQIGPIPIPYAIYAILGMAFWQLFSTGLIASSNSLVGAGSMLTRINFSKKSLVIAAMGQALVSFLVQLIFLCFFLIGYGFLPSIYIFLLPVLILPLLMLTLGLGFFAAILNAIARDIGNMLSTILTFVLFLTPILYSKPNTGGILDFITLVNPIYYLIVGPRDLILFGTMTELPGFLISSIISFAFFAIGIITFHMTESRVAEKI